MTKIVGISGYFDYAASNPLWPEASSAIAEAMSLVGNPSATHSFGQEVRKILDRSRDSAAKFLGAELDEITFTSGATEANNLAITGMLRPILDGWTESRRPRVMTSVLEHPSVNQPLERLAEKGLILLDYMPLTNDARVDLDGAIRMVDDFTVLVCLTAANNILGSIQPLSEMGKLLADAKGGRMERGNDAPLLFFSDAVQAAAWLPLDPKGFGLDALVISGHKVGGPKGVGLLWLRKGTAIDPLVIGGGQERGLRSGTENIPAIVGLATALDKATEIRSDEAVRCRNMRQRLISRLAESRSDIRVLGAGEDNSLSGTVYLNFSKTLGDILTVKLDAAGFAVSAGSACDAGHRRSPAVLESVYGGNTAKTGGIRISFGRMTTEDDIDRLVEALLRS